MRTSELLRDDWAAALDDFSIVHDGWLVSVDVLTPLLGAQAEIRELPLRGLTLEPGGALTMTLARPDGTHLTHRVEAPTRIWLEQTDEGADAALEVEARDGSKTIVRFRSVVLPEVVDGLVHH